MRGVRSTPVIVAVVALACVVGGVLGAWYAQGRQRPTSTAADNSGKQVARRIAAKHPAPAPKPFTFPSGDRVLAGTYRFVALYGSPDAPALGVLGEQPVQPAIDRIRALANEYQPLSTLPVYPTFEIITTVASESPTENGDYSREVDPAVIKNWIDAARTAGVYVVLDLQPGRNDFLSQLKGYTALLREPNVGLALDPEWRLAPNQVPLAQIGSVDASEVNGVVTWLADFTAQNHLPQKLLVLHQFRLDMITHRQNLDTSRPELAYVIQMDGQGSQPQKSDTYAAVTASPPPGVTFGWKNFTKKDTPTLDPTATMQLNPQPWYVSYQ